MWRTLLHPGHHCDKQLVSSKLTLLQCPEAARQTGFETLLANTAHDMGKGLTANGNLVVLQLMSEIYPALATHNVARFNELRNSYQVGD